MRTARGENSFLNLIVGLAAMMLSAAALSQTTFNGPAGATAIFPTSINAGGDVAGYYFDDDGSHGFFVTGYYVDSTGNYHGFILQGWTDRSAAPRAAFAAHRRRG
jgi:hypothetical protein